ncbi:MAG: hypothetical protein ABW098_07575 [Candidatus Thiodiazotropha sp.]
MYRTFNATQPAATDTAMHQKWSDAITAGMKVGRIQVDWSDLEPQPNQYDKSELEEKLIEMEDSGLLPFVLISTIDSEGYTLPDDITDKNSPTLLINGIHIDDSIILDRFENLLAWAVPMITAYGGWALAVGNEPGNFLLDNPQEEEHIVNFLSHARAYSHAINKQLAVAMTIAYWNSELGYEFHTPLIENSDFVSINYYATDTQSYFDDNAVSINSELDHILSLAGDKYVVFQELGASGGYDMSTSLMNASETKQAEFYEAFFTRMRSENLLKAAFIFQLVDWDPALVETHYTQPLTAAGLPEDFILRFVESYETIGLIKYTDGSERLAWSSVLEEITRLAQDSP